MAIPQIPDWRERILIGVGVKPTSENLRFMSAWAQAEGGNAENNPFNTTQVMGGVSRKYNDLGGGIGVQRYPDVQTGIDATVNTLTNGRYGNIIGALRQGDDAMKAAQALANSPWGTGALTMKVLGGHPGDFTPVGETAPTVGSPLSGTAATPLSGMTQDKVEQMRQYYKDNPLGGALTDASDRQPTPFPSLRSPDLAHLMRPSPIAVRLMSNLGEATKSIFEARGNPTDAFAASDQDNMPVTRTLKTLQSGSSESAYQTIDLAQDFDGPIHPNANPVVNMAQQYLGTPYLYGGADPRKGFDCSGFVQYLYAQAGVALERTTYGQIKQGQHIDDPSKLQAGDVVFFSQGGDVHHEGLYIGGGQFIHAPHTGDVVKISNLSEKYYASQFAGGRRFITSGDAPKT